jgi:hypothetical protein
VPQHRAIIELNLASEEHVFRALATLSQLEFVAPATLQLNPALLEVVPVKLVFHYRMVPVTLDGEVITLVFSEPPRAIELGNLRLLLGKRIKVAIGTPSSIHAAIKRHFGLGAETVQRLRAERGLADTDEEIVFDVKPAQDDAAVDSTIADFVDQVLLEAMRLQATDIHVEPYHDSIRLKYRIDGLLQTVPVPAGLRPLHGSIVSRLKIMAGLNIAEKRLPHDGRIAMKTGGDDYDLRVSVVPTKHGDGAGPGAVVCGPGEFAAGAGVADRADGQRQDHHPVCGAVACQRRPAQDHHDRGPGGVSAGGDHPDPGAGGHRVVLHLRAAVDSPA